MILDFLKINENKLKITLSAEDLSGWGLDAEDLDCADLRSRSLLRKLLRQAEREVGFLTERFRTLVQLYVSKDGGCELFVSRLAPKDSDSEEELFSVAKDPSAPSEDTLSVFLFDTLDWLLAVCRRLRQMGYRGQSRAYRGAEGKYYLILEDVDSFGMSCPNKYAFIYEFGSAESAHAVGQMLREHGQLLCNERAVEQLGVL